NVNDPFASNNVLTSYFSSVLVNPRALEANIRNQKIAFGIGSHRVIVGELDGARIGARGDDEIKFQLAEFVVVENLIDAGVDVAVEHAGVVTDSGAPFSRIVSEIPVADAGELIERLPSGAVVG